MSDLQIIPGQHNTYTYGVDEYGEFGSLATPDRDHEIPEPVAALTTSALDQELASLASPSN